MQYDRRLPDGDRVDGFWSWDRAGSRQNGMNQDRILLKSRFFNLKWNSYREMARIVWSKKTKFKLETRTPSQFARPMRQTFNMAEYYWGKISTSYSNWKIVLNDIEILSYTSARRKSLCCMT